MTQYTGKNFEKDILKVMEYAKEQITKFYIRWGLYTPSALNNLEGKIQDKEPQQGKARGLI